MDPGSEGSGGPALDRLQHEFAEFIESLPIAFVEFGLDDLRIRRMNLVGRIVSGCTEDDVRGGIPIAEVTTPESMQLFFEIAQLASTSREQGSLYARRMEQNIYETTLRRKDGSVYPAEIQGSFVLDERGVPVAARVMGRDISRRRAIEAQREQLVRHLQDALGIVKTLEGLLPICAWCRKVRDDAGYWGELERYIVDHAGASLSHGICPECAKRYLGPEAGEA
jgi:PAS domain S-box-containing protein